MRKRIAIISEHASPLADLGSVDSGGQNVYVAQVSRHLARAGYLVDVFTRRDDPTKPLIHEWEDGVRIIHVPAGSPEYVRKEQLLEHMPAFTSFVIDFFNRRSKPYDLVHANFWMSGLVAADIKSTLGIPFVITFHALGRVRRQHQGNQDMFPDVRFEIEDQIVQKADGIIAECPQDKHDLIQLYRADPAKISLIPCGFDPEELWPVDKVEAREKIGLGKDDWLVLQLGRMVPRKGVDTAIRGFAGLVKSHHAVNAQMVIVGGESREPDPTKTPEFLRLQKIAREEGISDRITFTGRRSRDEIKYYYSAADVFISTPWYEPFGITPVESMACGTPVIGSEVGGIKYTVADGVSGYLVPVDNPDIVAQRLGELYHDPATLKRLSKQAIARTNKMFTWQRVSNMMSDFYEEVITKAGTFGKVVFTDQPTHAGAIDQILVVEQSFEAALQVIEQSRQVLGKAVIEAADTLANCFESGGKVLVCGNGGSAAESQHFAGELVGRFISRDRKGLPVQSLTADTAFLTAWSNDIGYEKVFSRQVEAYGQPGDVLIGISTSGCSANLVEAFKAAREMGIVCVALLGGDGGELLPLSDISIVVPTSNTQRIQEVQVLVIHLLCELVENKILANRLKAPKMGLNVLGDTQAPLGGASYLEPAQLRGSD